MSSKLIIINSETGQTIEYELLGQEESMGRSTDRNTIVLDDSQVSRQHATLQRLGSTYMLVDLNSANGTSVNGNRIKEQILNDGDLISISKYNITYKKMGTVAVKFDNQRIGNTVLLRNPEQVISSLPQINKGTISQADLTSQSFLDDIEALRKKAETLSRLYELNQMLGSVFSLEDIFKKVSEMLFRLTPADRFLVLAKDQHSDKLSPIATEFRMGNGGPLGSEISISRTVLDKVLGERVSLLSFDAQGDERLAQAKSIIMQNIHSVMCAPMLGKNGLLGVIYVDCLQVLKMFSEDDLDLLNALAAETAIAVDNAITHDQLLREALARATYGRFMPKHVVDAILANPDQISMGGTNALVTILFSDVRGFTSMSENLPPETVVQILNEYFADMAPIVFQHQGLLDKYMGDGLMALFGVPYQDENAAINAVAAAVDMQRRMAHVNEDLKARGLSEIAIGIGINSGTVTVGYIGSEERTDYTAIGDAVNLAARLEKEAQAWQIIISHATRETVGDRFAVKPKGEVHVKGKRESVQIYEVIWQEA